MDIYGESYELNNNTADNIIKVLNIKINYHKREKEKRENKNKIITWENL